jgi:hypothetical protein
LLSALRALAIFNRVPAIAGCWRLERQRVARWLRQAGSVELKRLVARRSA